MVTTVTMVSSDSPLVIYDPHPHITLFQVNLKAPLNRQARLPRIGRTENDFQKIQATRRDSSDGAIPSCISSRCKFPE
jgi:hypothetical protein